MSLWVHFEGHQALALSCLFLPLLVNSLLSEVLLAEAPRRSGILGENPIQRQLNTKDGKLCQGQKKDISKSLLS